jgi:hypothetical protein
MESVATPLPEQATVYWRPRVTAEALRRAGRLWTLVTAVQVVPFLAFAIFLGLTAPVTLPLGLVLLVYAWMIPELYAARGAGVVRARRQLTLSAGARRTHEMRLEVETQTAARPAQTQQARQAAESRALGMLADLIDRSAYELHERSGLVLERGGLGIWLVAESGALLVRPGGRRVHCYCVGVREPDLPSADRVAHLLLALRCDEAGFATVANQAFVGMPWRLRRRLPARARSGLDAAVAVARSAA